MGPHILVNGYKCAHFRSNHEPNYVIIPQITLANILHENKVNISAGKDNGRSGRTLPVEN
jgi:hypothetical protein